MMGVLRSFDKNYPGFNKRKMLNKRKVALQLTMICFFLVFFCILLLVAQRAQTPTQQSAPASNPQQAPANPGAPAK